MPLILAIKDDTTTNEENYNVKEKGNKELLEERKLTSIVLYQRVPIKNGVWKHTPILLCRG